MSDQIAVMSAGKILQQGTSREIYLEPVSASVARIAGNVNVLEGTLVKSGEPSDVTEVLLASGKVFRCRMAETRTGEGRVEVMFRPELVSVRLGDETEVPGDDDAVNSLAARVERVDFTGDHLKVQFETADGSVIAKLAPDLVLSEGGDVTLLIKAENCVAQ